MSKRATELLNQISAEIGVWADWCPFTEPDALSEDGKTMCDLIEKALRRARFEAFRDAARLIEFQVAAMLDIEASQTKSRHQALQRLAPTLLVNAEVFDDR